MITVLLTCGRAPVTRHLAALLSQGGARVWVADSVPSLTWGQKGVAGTLRHPRPDKTPEGFARWLKEICETKGVDVIWPCGEEILHVAQAAWCEGLSGKVFAPSFETLSRAHDKQLFAQWCKTLSLPVAETRKLGHCVKCAPDVWESPSDWVFKPRFSRFATHTMVGPKESSALLSLKADPRGWLAQRLERGRELCVQGVFRDGVLFAHVVYEPRWRVGQGASTSQRRVDVPAALSFLETFGSRTRWTGAVAFDLIERDDGSVWALECNPMMTTGAQFWEEGTGLVDFLARKGDAQPPKAVPALLSLPSMALFQSWRAVRDPAMRSLWKEALRGRSALKHASDLSLLWSVPLVMGSTLFRAWKDGVGVLESSTQGLIWNEASEKTWSRIRGQRQTRAKGL